MSKKTFFTSNLFYLTLLVLIILTVYAPFYIKGFLGDFGDPLMQELPNKILLIEYLKNGIAPFWNSFSSLGMPFLADIQAGALYFPDYMFFSAFSPTTAHNISLLSHIIFGTIGFYFFINILTKNKNVALLTAIIFAFGGGLMNRLVFLNFLETLSFLPWLLFIIARQKKIFLLLPPITALMIFAGHPVAAFYNFLILLIFTIFYLQNFKEVLKNFAALFLGVAISGIQLLPFWNLKMHSLRDNLSFEAFLSGSLTIKEFIKGNLLPNRLPWDLYIHFGIITALTTFASIFFFKRFSKKQKKIYLIGLVLMLCGTALVVSGSLKPLALFLYHLPPFNLARVAARYIVIFHVGMLLSLAVFLSYLFQKRKQSAVILSIFIFLNTILVPFVFLYKHDNQAAKQQFHPEIKTAIQEDLNQNLSLFTPPNYILNTSIFLQPNRNYQSLLPSIIGYNPLRLKIHEENFPLSPIGTFQENNYLQKYFPKFQNLGLKYYIFPSKSYLKAHNYGPKEEIFHFLSNKNWQKIYEDNQKLIFKNPAPKPFAHFQNTENTAQITHFQPGKIILKIEAKTPDTLVLNQSYYPYWQAETSTETIPAKPHKNLVQSYQIPAGTEELTITYQATDIKYGASLSLLALLAFALINKKIL